MNTFIQERCSKFIKSEHRELYIVKKKSIKKKCCSF